MGGKKNKNKQNKKATETPTNKDEPKQADTVEAPAEKEAVSD